ncbi:ATP-binding protein [Actinophytocola sp.]|uniref:ATP-binding protein n=1 Tax=Actinophytocola sp. TaxID=1872138 RepID=UPI00389A58B4
MSARPASPADDGERRPAGTSPTNVTCALDKTPNSHVRDLVRDLLAGRSGVMVEDAVLVADELVSNAHQHGDAPRHCRLVLLDNGSRLRIEVDDSSPHPPRARTPDSSGGRGLILVDRLSSRWGVQRHAHHKTVWAELALDRPGSSGHAPHMTAMSNRLS